MACLLISRALQRGPRAFTAVSLEAAYSRRFRSNRNGRPRLENNSDTQSPLKPLPPENDIPHAASAPDTFRTPPLEASTPPPPPPPANALSLDFSAGDEPPAQEARTGARSSEGSLTSLERKRRRILRIFFGTIFAGLCAGVVHLGRGWEPEELNGKRSIEADAGRWERTKYRFKVFTGLFVEPIREEILPPRLEGQPYQPYVLLLPLDDFLIASKWDRQHGWRTAKRPGFEYFMGYLSNWYEVIIFTTQPDYTAGPIIEKLDPIHIYIMGAITREYTRYHDGQVVKDITHINRDLSKVVALDTDPSRYAFHPDNVVGVPKWNGDPKDRGLVALIPFLESLAIYNAPDVREIIKHYKGKDVVAECARIEAEAKKRHIEAWKRSGKGEVAAPTWLSRLFNIGAHSSATTSGPPLTYLEKKRKEAQEWYLANLKHWKDHEEEIKKGYENWREQQVKEMGPTSLSRVFTDLFTGGGDNKNTAQETQLQSKQSDRTESSGSTIVPITGK